MISAGITPALASLHPGSCPDTGRGPYPADGQIPPRSQSPSWIHPEDPRGPVQPGGPGLSRSQLGWPMAVPSGLAPASAQATSVSAQAAPNTAAAQTHVPHGVGGSSLPSPILPPAFTPILTDAREAGIRVYVWDFRFGSRDLSWCFSPWSPPCRPTRSEFCQVTASVFMKRRAPRGLGRANGPSE